MYPEDRARCRECAALFVKHGNDGTVRWGLVERPAGRRIER
jgi:hypothetical protein